MNGPRLSIACLLLSLAARLPGLEVHLAPLVYMDETGGGSRRSRPEADILRAMGEIRAGERLFVVRLPDPGESPRSLLEAARLSELHACAHLLYGYVRRTSQSLHAEIKLYDREAGAVSAVFFASDDLDHYQRLVRDVAGKILAHLYGPGGVDPQPPVAEPERRIFTVPCSAGIWIPTAADWTGVMTGLAAAGAGVRLVPARPLFVLGRRPGYVAIGLDLDYALGRNQPGYESFLLHAFRVRLPAEVFLDYPGGHSAGIGFGPLLAVDLVAQDRKYDELSVGTTVAAGLSVSLAYRHTLTERLAVGLATLVDVVGYDRPLVTVSPRLHADFRPGAARRERGDE